MGNCCEVVNSKLEKLLEANCLSSSYSTKCHSRKLSDSLNDSINLSSSYEQKFNKFRNPKYKLKTIIEDYHEDLIGSPIRG